MRDLTLIVILTILCTKVVGAQSAQARRAADEDSIREAIIRTQIAHNPVGEQANIFFVSLGKGKGKDAPARFLKRFTGSMIVVKKGSDCHFDPKPLPDLGIDKSSAYMIYGIRDKKTGKPGVQMYIGKIKWISRHRAKLDFRYYSGGLSAGHYTDVLLVRRNGSWSVKDWGTGTVS